MKEKIKLLLVGFLWMVIWGTMVTALTVDVTVPSLTAYLKKLFLTTDGTPNWAPRIVIDGGNGSITMQWALNIRQWALKDNTVVSADIVNGTIKAEDIGIGQVVNTNLASNSVTSDKIVDWTITAADLWAGSVGNSELQNNSVTSNKIADWTITASDLSANIDVSSSIDGKNVKVDYARYAASAWSATTVTSAVDKAKKLVSSSNTVIADATYGDLRVQGFLRAYKGLAIYSNSQNWVIFWKYTYIRSDRGPRVEYAWDWRISAGNNPDTAFAKKLAWAMVALKSIYYSCVKVSYITAQRRTADRWGNFTYPDAFSRRYYIKCYY